MERTEEVDTVLYENVGQVIPGGYTRSIAIMPLHDRDISDRLDELAFVRGLLLDAVRGAGKPLLLRIDRSAPPGHLGVKTIALPPTDATTADFYAVEHHPGREEQCPECAGRGPGADDA